MVFKFFLIALVSGGIALIGMESQEFNKEDLKIFFGSQEKLNEVVAKYASTLYQKMNSRPCWPTIGKSISTTSNMWQEESAYHDSPIFEIKSKYVVFRLNAGEKPYEALCDFFNKREIIECAIALHIVEHLILGKIIGEQLFNKIYAGEFLLPSRNGRGLEIMGYGIPTTPGHFGYIPNIKEYPEWHRNGIARGENVFCVSNNGIPLYAGFGKFFADGPKTKEEIVEYLYLNLCEAPLVKKAMAQRKNEFKPEEIYTDWKEKREELQKQCPILGLSLNRLVQEKLLIVYNDKYINRFPQWAKTTKLPQKLK